jgi:hypothetical protein
MNPEKLFQFRAPQASEEAPGESEVGAGMAMELAKIAAAAISLGLQWERSEELQGAFEAPLPLPGVRVRAYAENLGKEGEDFAFGVLVEGQGDFAHGPANSIFADAFWAASNCIHWQDVAEFPGRIRRLRSIWAKLAESHPELTAQVRQGIEAATAKEPEPQPEPEGSELPNPRQAGREYRKTATIFAVQMDRPFEVVTLEGVMQGAAGDWLAQGPAGDHWPIKDAIFKATYVECD